MALEFCSFVLSLFKVHKVIRGPVQGILSSLIGHRICRLIWDVLRLSSALHLKSMKGPKLSVIIYDVPSS